MKTAVEKHVHALAKVASRETARARAEVTRLDNDERKLLQAHYTDKISDHIYTDEQQRIRRERGAAEELLRRYEIKHDVIVQTLDLALQLTDRTQAAYL